jgi:hypothetical protein
VTISPRFLSAKPDDLRRRDLQDLREVGDGDELVHAHRRALALLLRGAQRLHLLARVLAAPAPAAGRRAAHALHGTRDVVGNRLLIDAGSAPLLAAATVRVAGRGAGARTGIAPTTASTTTEGRSAAHPTAATRATVVPALATLRARCRRGHGAGRARRDRTRTGSARDDRPPAAADRPPQTRRPERSATHWPPASACRRRGAVAAPDAARAGPAGRGRRRRTRRGRSRRGERGPLERPAPVQRASPRLARPAPGPAAPRPARGACLPPGVRRGARPEGARTRPERAPPGPTQPAPARPLPALRPSRPARRPALESPGPPAPRRRARRTRRSRRRGRRQGGRGGERCAASPGRPPARPRPAREWPHRDGAAAAAAPRPQPRVRLERASPAPSARERATPGRR